MCASAVAERPDRHNDSQTPPQFSGMRAIIA
jgi:hypothetical protein